MKPFLRWAGGKSWLIKELDTYLPRSFNNYFEPFLGGGSVFISLKSRDIISKKSLLSDVNKDLINAYEIVKQQPEELIKDLQTHSNEVDYYYKIRSTEFDDPIQRASKFIFLNRTSFNGIYRENAKGQYNVPYGFKEYSALFDYDNIRFLNQKFKKSIFEANDFFEIASRVKRRDFVFIDPPYTVAHGNNGFIKYNQKIFSWDDQIKLNDLLEILNRKGAYFIMTNAHHQSIIDLFSDQGEMKTISRPSVVGGKNAKRTIYNEIILTNIVK